MAETELNDDLLIYLGKVAEWLKSSPEGKVSYGEFYATEVVIHFDDEVTGKFLRTDDYWTYTTCEQDSHD